MISDLYCGDCLEEMNKIEDESVDAIITDPPYGTTDCKWDAIIPFESMWKQLKRIIKKNGAIVLFGSEPFGSGLRMSNIKNYKYDWIWKKTIGSNYIRAKKEPLKIHENICVFSNGIITYNSILKPKCKKNVRNTKTDNHANFKSGHQFYGRKVLKYNEKREIPIDMKYADSVIEIKSIGNNNKNRVHPTQKPVALMEYLIKTYTNEGETVLDFTMGSGTTGVACKNLDRNFIGIEKDEKYFKIAEERINNVNNHKGE